MENLNSSTEPTTSSESIPERGPQPWLEDYVTRLEERLKTKEEKFFTHDRSDPSPWLALYLDNTVPMDESVKRAICMDMSTKCRQLILPLARPIVRLSMALIQVYRSIFPNLFASSKLLHRLLVLGMKYFVTPEGNYIVSRHFHQESQILAFLRDNIEGVKIDVDHLGPMKVEDFADHLFLKHDIAVYNFVIDLNHQLRDGGMRMKAKAKLDYSAIQEIPLKISDFRRGWTNFIDIETSVELYTPVFQLLLTDSEFWRASHSLQLDETFALYYAKLFGLMDRMHLLHNRHPLVPEITSSTAKNLVLHGLSTESFHATMMRRKKAACASSSS